MKEINALLEIIREHESAIKKFGKFHNAHEGYAVLLEEMDKLWECVKIKQSDSNPERNSRLQKKATQVAAMALRFLIDCIPDEK
jgi:hypothetical protein